MDDAELIHQLRNPHGHSQIVMRLAAADRIEALTAQLAAAKCKEALKPLALPKPPGYGAAQDTNTEHRV